MFRKRSSTIEFIPTPTQRALDDFLARYKREEEERKERCWRRWLRRRLLRLAIVIGGKSQ